MSSASSDPRAARLPAPRLGLVALAAILALFLVVPVVALVARSLAEGALGIALSSPAILDALVLSLTTTAVSMVVVVAFGTPLAFLLARRSFRGASLVDAGVNLPIVLPPAVAGLALLLVFGRTGIVGSSLEAAGIAIPFTTAAVVLAQVFVAAPFFILAARSGIAGVDGDIEDAARVDGASEWQLVRWVTLPLASPALAAGLVMCWARALGEFGATIMFAGNVPGRTQTLPLAVYAEFQSGDLEASIAAAAILVIAAFGVLVAVRFLRWGRPLDPRVGA
jgi:molybdate transport system permease protein